ncbi:MAG: flagellar hook-length control protein FliK [Clostridiales bacterium]|nr:flagellar hook-length control protein FliK [Clostridiales bacterium]
MTAQIISANQSVGVQSAGASLRGKNTGTGQSANGTDFGSLLKSNANSDAKSTVRSNAEAQKKTGFYQKENQAGKKLDKAFGAQDKASRSEELSGYSSLDDEIPEEAVEAVSAVMNQFVSLVSDVTGVSGEEIGALMDELGIQAADLLDGDSLKQLLMQLNGSSDEMDFLTDEWMAQQFHDISQGLSDIISKEFPDLPKDQLASLMNGVLNKDSFKTEVLTTPEDSSFEENASGTTLEDGLPDIKVDREQASLSKEPSSSGEGSKGMKEENSHVSHAQAVNQFVSQLSDSISTDAFGENVDSLRTMREIVTQVVDQIRITIRQEASSMELQLNPENLGKVNLAVTAKNGQMTATFTVTTETTKEALESQIQVLKDTLEEQGLKVEAVEVNVSEFAFEQSRENEQNQQNPQKKTQRQFDLKDLKESSFEDLTDEEQNAAVRMDANESTVDYTA